MDIHIIRDHVSRAELQKIAEERFGDMVKAVVDLKQRIMALGPEMHADAESALIEQGSLRENLWGINFYPDERGDAFLEFDSMINIRPAQGNRSRGVEDASIREQIKKIVADMVTE